MYSLLFAPLLFAGVLAAPLENRAAAPSVTIKNGTVVGSSSNGIDSFKGVPFAQPPVGSLRLKPPQTVTATYGTITATGTPTACPQFLEQVNTTNLASDVIGEVLDSPFFQTISNTGEDCLTVNVQRPSTATSSSNLPVVFWIYGGGFEFGSTQTYDGTPLVQRSIALGEPIIFVAVNYRLGGFGFLAGSELQKDGSTNLGLRDQRLGLQWVQDNVAAFGGDPTKVTIWGESAGSISVYDQMIINGGDNTYNGNALFRGAIMDSGSIVPAEPVTDSKAQAVYNQVVANAGCSGASDTLACLRTVPYQTLLAATNSLPGIFSYQSLALAYLPRPDPANNFFPVSPEVPVLQGSGYAKVPFIIGDQEDEGTLFSLDQENITTTAELVSYVSAAYPNTPQSVTAGLVATYPDDITAGSPFRTGLLNAIYPQYKRLAAIFGDSVFNLRRRQLLYAVSSTVNTWSYLDSHLYGTPVLGTFHASDVLEIYDDLPSLVTALTFQNYYVSFVNYLDPNAIDSGEIEWPQYSTSNPELVQFQALSNNLLADTFRSASFNYLQQYPTSFRT
ncbi:hypothetical protein MBLNU459_g2513t1 [Dothideomycetes sp. NU459]